MTDFPYTGVPPLMFNVFNRYGPVPDVQTAITPTAAITWPAANQAFYYPFFLPWPYPIRRVFWANGSSVTSTNFDFGIYTADGTRIYNTTSTAASGASVLQYVTPTEFLLAPGRYYMAISCSSTTASRGGTGIGGISNALAAMAGILIEASALPLPATMTPATTTTTVIPICGFTYNASGF